jgi:hypothetical protein
MGVEIRFLRPEEVGEGVWKFVRVGGQYRFFDISHRHVDVVDEEDRSRTTEAGVVGVFFGGAFRVLESSSVTLQISGVDKEALALALGRRALG